MNDLFARAALEIWNLDTSECENFHEQLNVMKKDGLKNDTAWTENIATIVRLWSLGFSIENVRPRSHRSTFFSVLLFPFLFA